MRAWNNNPLPSPGHQGKSQITHNIYIWTALECQEYAQNQFNGSKKKLLLKLEKQDFINFLISVKLCAHTAVKSFPFISWNVKRKSKCFSLLAGLTSRLTWKTSSQKVENPYCEIAKIQMSILCIRSNIQWNIWSNTHIRPDIWSNIRSGIWSYIRSDIRSNIRSDIPSDIWSDIESAIRSAIRSDIWSDIRSDISNLELLGLFKSLLGTPPFKENGKKIKPPIFGGKLNLWLPKQILHLVPLKNLFVLAVDMPKILQTKCKTCFWGPRIMLNSF